MEGSLLTLHNSSSTLVLLIDRNRLAVYGGGNLSQVVSLDIPLTVVKDIDVVDRPAFDALIQSWLTQNKVPTADVVVVLSEATYFARDETQEGKDEAEKEAAAFTDSMPFEKVAMKRYPLERGYRIVCVNDAFLDTIIAALRVHDLAVVAVVPSFLLGPHGDKHVLDTEMGKYIVGHVDKLKSQSVVGPVEHGSSTTGKDVAVFAKKNQRFVVFLGVFVVLIIVLAILLLLR